MDAAVTRTLGRVAAELTARQHQAETLRDRADRAGTCGLLTWKARDAEARAYAEAARLVTHATD